MTKIAMVSLKQYRYGGRLLKPGGKFEAEGQSHARLLRAIKHAEYAPAAPVVEAKPPVAPVVAPAKVAPVFQAPAPVVKAAAPAAEPVKPPAAAPEQAAAPDAEDPAARVKRQYRRRDCVAEE